MRLHLLVLVLTLTSAVQGQQLPIGQRDHATMMLIGTVVKIEGDTITLAAALNPKLTRTFRMEADTKILQKAVEVSRSVIVPGSRVIVYQDRRDGALKTSRVHHLVMK